VLTRKPLLLVLAAICVYIGLFTFLQFRLYDAFRMGLRDLGFFQQALESVLDGRPLLIRQGYTADTSVSNLFYNGWEERSLFSEHVYLYLPLFLPLYALWRAPYVLLVLNAIGIGLAALPLYLLARRRLAASSREHGGAGDRMSPARRLQSDWLAAVVALMFLAYPAVQVATLGDYIYGMHPDNFAPLFLFAALYFADCRKPRSFWLMALLALSTVESVAPTVAAIGLYTALTLRDWRRHGLWLAAIAALFFLVSTLIVIPLAGGGRSPYYFAALQTLPAAVANPQSLMPLAQAILDLAGALLVPLVGLPLLGGPLWLIALPELVSGVAAKTVGYSIPMEYGSWHVWAYVLAAFLSLIQALVFLQRRSRLWLAAALILLPIGALAGILWYGPYPFSRNVWPPAYDVDSEKAAFIARVASGMPEDASLSAEFFLGSHFAGRPNVYWFPVNWRQAQYVLVDSGAWAWWSDDDGRALSALQRSAYVEPVDQFGRVYFFRHRPLPVVQQPLSTMFADGIELSGYNLESPSVAAGAPMTVTLFWRAHQPIPVDLTVFVHVVDQTDQLIAQRDSQPDDGAYPTSEWPLQDLIMDRRIIRIPAGTAPGTYGLELGWYDLATGKRVPSASGADSVQVAAIEVKP
jgi:uncharacterized membrane protein